MSLKTSTAPSTKPFLKQLEQLNEAIEQAEGLVIGAGAGLSSAAGFHYDGERFDQYFADFRKKYGIRDMYSGGFFPFPSQEEYWAWWSRHIWLNRYVDIPKATYKNLLALVKDKDYFVLTTNVDHCFQKSGFAKKRLFYTQGDYGLWQCSRACHEKTYDNKDAVEKMLLAQGFVIAPDGALLIPEGQTISMTIPGEWIPHCPVCGAPMTMNLRADDTFVEDAGWHQAANRYQAFLHSHEQQRMLYLELGVGSNTPGIIKYPFWRMTANNPKATYACINAGQAYRPDEIGERSICVNGDIDAALDLLQQKRCSVQGK